MAEIAEKVVVELGIWRLWFCGERDGEPKRKKVIYLVPRGDWYLRWNKRWWLRRGRLLHTCQ